MDTTAPSNHAVLEFTSGEPAGQVAKQFADDAETIASEVRRVVVTSPQTVQLAILGLFAEGHILLEDNPGVGKTLLGKTLLGKTLAGAIACDFKRIQFTPDLLPTDITGTTVFDMKSSTFKFVPGPIFANIVLADEINRTGPRTQSALLEAMAEHQVSIEGDVMKLPSPFMVIATQNLSESHGTFPLPDSQKDRFMISMGMGLPDAEQEIEILTRSQHGMPEVEPVITAERIVVMRDTVKRVEVDIKIRQYIVKLATHTRANPSIRQGPEPTGRGRAAKGGTGMGSDGRPDVRRTSGRVGNRRLRDFSPAHDAACRGNLGERCRDGRGRRNPGSGVSTPYAGPNVPDPPISPQPRGEKPP